MKSPTTREFWRLFDRLPKKTRFQAVLAYHRWRTAPYHSSLQYKRVGHAVAAYSVRISRDWRALGLKTDEIVTWFWIGSHAEYDKLLQEE